MTYHFVNIETEEYLYCSDEEWLQALQIAESEGFKGSGTRFDIIYDIESDMDIINDVEETYKEFMFRLSWYCDFHWNGSYTEKANQIVEYEDTIYLAKALESARYKGELLEFIKKGSFRICSS